MSREDEATRRMGFWAGVLLIAALPLSGPLGMAIIAAVAPQPPWRDAATFIAHYHPIQALPFLFGFLLLLGFAALQATLFLRARGEARPWALVGLVFTAVFCALIAFNYIAQTALVPAAVRRGDGAAVATLAMASPSSICWSIEMFGYGFLGLASLCVAPLFRGRGLARATAWLLVANGALSVAGAVMTAIDAAWVLTTAGLACFALWNVVVLAMVVLLTAGLRRGSRVVVDAPDAAGWAAT